MNLRSCVQLTIVVLIVMYFVVSLLTTAPRAQDLTALDMEDLLTQKPPTSSSSVAVPFTSTTAQTLTTAVKVSPIDATPTRPPVNVTAPKLPEMVPLVTFSASNDRVKVPVGINRELLRQVGFQEMGRCEVETAAKHPGWICGDVPRLWNEKKLPGILYCCPAGTSHAVFSARRVFASGRGPVFDEHVFYGYENHYKRAFDVAVDAGSSLQVVDRAFNLLHIWPANYFHTVIDVLSYVWQVRDLLRAHPEIPVLFTQRLRLDIILTLLGWRESDIGEVIRVPQDSVVLVETLYFPAKRYPAIQADWESIRAHFFTDTIPRLTGTTPPPKAQSLQIVILKRITSTRRALVDTELLEQALVDRYGPLRVTVFNGTQTLAEAVLIFSRATLLVGPHGAGLANMIFCPPGAAILEILPDQYQNGCFKDLTLRMGFSYSNIMGKGDMDSPLSANITLVVAKTHELAGQFTL